MTSLATYPHGQPVSWWGCLGPGNTGAAQPQRLHHGPALPRPTHNALAPAERDQIIEVLTSAEFVDKAPVQVYYTLLERGCYLAPVFHDGADDGIAAWGESMTVRGYDVGPAGAAGLRFSGS